MYWRPTTILLLIAFGVGLSVSQQDWWQNSNFYQIYPRSFKDSNGDGIGDLIGIAQNMEYLKDIGMVGVWLSPIMKSPMNDFGYDISDYTQIQDEYGNLDDLRALLQEAHRLGLKLILDFVPNHTSDQHEWFKRSVNGDPEYRDFYVWHDGVINATTGERQPPSNWICSFRKTAWQWHEQRQQYYLHQFGITQPDLNYRNPAVHEAMKNVLKYWLEFGIDGFRIDAIPYLYEAEIDPATGTYPDEPVIADVASCPDPEAYCHLDHIYTMVQPGTIDVIYDWRELMDDWKREHNTETKVLLTEGYTTLENLMLIYGNGTRAGAEIPFNLQMFQGLSNSSTADDYLYYIQRWIDNMPEGAYANWLLGNHDNRRIATRFGLQRTDLINILLQTLPGIAVTYNGEEYGVPDVFISWKDTVDIQGCNAGPEHFNDLLSSRDPARTPFRWNSSPNAGFSTAAKTWLPVGEGYETLNVEAELAADKSHLKVFKRLTEVRREPTFNGGTFEPVVNGGVLLYRRQDSNGNANIVVLNIGDDDATLDLVALFPGTSSTVEVVTSSIQSGLDEGQLLDAKNFEAKAYNGYVLRVISDS